MADEAKAETTPAAMEKGATAEAEAETTFVVAEFRRQLEDPDLPIQVAAIRALTELIRHTTERTAQGLLIELRAAADQLQRCPQSLLRGKTTISVAAGCELLVRHVTRTSKFDHRDYEAFKKVLVERGEDFGTVSLKSRAQIARTGSRFIRDGAVILVHGYSRVVCELLLAAAKSKHFSVIVTEGRPDDAGFKTCKALSAAEIPTRMVLDSAMGFTMEKVDMVLVGAEGVVENGGIINKIGTYQLAVVAAAFNTPVYVAAESFKFARLFPLSQRDLADSVAMEGLTAVKSSFADHDYSKMTIDNPSCDYTPPKYLTLLWTDLGVLTPSAVSDELIKLYS